MEPVISSQKSSLNPNAAPFVPASYKAVEDFSSEWWDLVQNEGWYRDYWLSQQQLQQQEEEDTDAFFSAFHEESEQHHDDNNDDNDIANLLPSTLDLGFDEEDYYINHTETSRLHSFSVQPQQEKYVEPDVGALMKTLSLSPSARGGRYSKSTVPVVDPMKKYYYHEKLAAAPPFSPKSGAWRIYQPR